MSQREPPDPQVLVLVVAGPIADGDVQSLCERLRVMASAAAGRDIVCDVATLAPDAVSVDALARLQLTARRLGCRIGLRHASRELGRLLSFFGLADVLPLVGALGGLQPQRQAEEREHPLGVEERVDRHDPPA